MQNLIHEKNLIGACGWLNIKKELNNLEENFLYSKPKSSKRKPHQRINNIEFKNSPKSNIILIRMHS